MKHIARQIVYNRLEESYRRIRESEFREKLEMFREHSFKKPEVNKKRKWDFQSIMKDEREMLLL